SYKPSHPELFRVVFGDNLRSFTYSSKLVTTRSFKKGETIAKIAGYTQTNVKKYTSVQIGPDCHIELNSDLVYMNHNCDPSVQIDCNELKIVAARDLDEGDEITFFYPSTEWEMAQPFTCWCGASQCVGMVQGAKHIPTAILKKYYVNDFIMKL
ncbi:hypothetical protein BKA69DRAFT_1018252, partial [Paraphysoderma sedebokerense]